MMALFAASAVTAGAQTDFNKEWKAVDKLYDDENYTQAYEKASGLFGEAQRLGDSRNTLAGAFHLSRISAEYQEDATDSALNRYNAIIGRLEPVDRALCHAFLAKFYSEYRWRNRWRINQNSDTDEPDFDYKLWPDSRFQREIRAHLDEALKNETALRQTDIADVEPFCSKPYGDGLLTTPTLYDLVVNLAMESTSDHTEKLRLHQRLVDFHSSDNVCLRIWLDLRELELRQHVPNKPKPTAADYERYAEKYLGSGCDLVTLFYHEAAQILYGERKFVEAKALCDKAISIAPESNGGQQCQNLANQIVHPYCDVTMTADERADHDMLAVATSRNTDSLYFRIIKQFDHSKLYVHEDIVKAMAKRPVLQQWSMALSHRNDFQEQKNYVYMPPMPTGEYYLLVSTSNDFKANGLSYGKFTCCDIQIVNALPGNALRGYVLLRGSGEPVAGQRLRLERYDYDKRKYLPVSGGTAVTDATGYYEFADRYDGGGSLHVLTEYKGVSLTLKASNHSNTVHYDNISLYCQLDRPVYKLGETVSFAYVVHSGDRHTRERVCQDVKLTVHLLDVNRKSVDSLQLTTDEFGVCHGELKIPSDALPGQFQLHTEYKVGEKNGHDYDNVNVEEYKQPKFTVKMYGDKQRHEFGNELSVSGLAASYSEAPVDGAKVSYTVVRREMYRPWRWWYKPIAKETVVAGGETETDADGRFEIRFTPTPDSSVELSNKPCFVYTVHADVTDLNG